MMRREKRRGNCYVTCESLYHLLGGKAAGWTPHTVRHEGVVHWYLVNCNGLDADTVDGDTAAFALHLGELGDKFILDPTVSQFEKPPPYHLGRGRGFLTKKPSKRARAMMKLMVYQ
jgi:hypothetical protein